MADPFAITLPPYRLASDLTEVTVSSPAGTPPGITQTGSFPILGDGSDASYAEFTTLNESAGASTVNIWTSNRLYGDWPALDISGYLSEIPEGSTYFAFIPTSSLNVRATLMSGGGSTADLASNNVTVSVASWNSSTPGEGVAGANFANLLAAPATTILTYAPSSVSGPSDLGALALAGELSSYVTVTDQRSYVGPSGAPAVVRVYDLWFDPIALIVYPPDTSVPTTTRPLRQFPREDGLGASSAPRLFPRPRSVQAGFRKAGGTYL